MYIERYVITNHPTCRMVRIDRYQVSMCVTSRRDKIALTLSYLDPNKILKTSLSIDKNPGLAGLCRGLYYNIYHLIYSSQPYY